MKIAVVGSGIAGLSCAWKLSQEHEVTLYEAGNYLGGHTNTVDITVDGIAYPVDTGFLVFNHRTYPKLIKLFADLGVQTATTDMSFSVSLSESGKRGLEWAGTDLNSVFAQRSNLLNPRFLHMLVDILRFNKKATALALEGGRDNTALSLGEFLDREGFSEQFRDWYLLPMAAAIWSCSTSQMSEFPLATFVRFCHNHGLLQVLDRPQWSTVVGGGREYVRKLTPAIRNIRLGEPVLGVSRTFAPTVAVRTAGGTDIYDEVVLACHSDQALALLSDASAKETALLGAIGYQPNRAILHTDAKTLPQRESVWAAWNYQCGTTATRPNERSVCVHYLINKLQPVPFTRPVVVSLNPFERPAESSILAEFDYAHPVFDRAAIAAQARLAEIQGCQRVWFCGAWTGYGFHEDGLKSGLAVADALLAESVGGKRSPQVRIA